MVDYGRELNISVQTLDAESEKYIEFSCGNESIDDYLHYEAIGDQSSVTYLYIDVDRDKLIAFVTIACSAIFTISDHEQYSTVMPSMEVKFLAVDESYQHLPYNAMKNSPSLSDMMFDDMIMRMIDISRTIIGASSIVLYSVPQAITFYQRHGFKKFGDNMYGDEGLFIEGCEPMYLDLNF